MTYMNIDDPNAFFEMEKKDKAEYEKHHGEGVECPKCHGYGGWRLRLNAYGPGVHFNASCFQCNGWGYVNKHGEDAYCVHEYKEISQTECCELGIQHFGMCWHVTRCVKCGRVTSYDSSG